VIIALSLTQTKQFKNFAKNKVIQIVNQNINGKIFIHELEGNFFRDLHLKKIKITLLDGDTLLLMDKISLNYSLLPLLKKNIELNSLIFEKPNINLIALDDSTWNIMSLFPENKHDTLKTTTSFNLPFAINIESFILDDGQVTIRDTIDLLPELIENINIDFKGQYNQDNTLTASLNTLTFSTQSPDIQLLNLMVDIEFDTEKWFLRNLRLSTAQNSIKANAEYKDFDNFETNIEIPEIEVKEFGFAFPNIIIPANPDFKIAVSKIDEKVNLNLSLGYKSELLELSGSVDEFTTLIESPQLYNSPFEFGVKLVNFRPNTWIEMEHIPLLANIDMNISGNGIKPDTMKMRIKSCVSGTVWHDFLLKTGNIDASYDGGKVNADVELATIFGEITAKTKFDIFTHDNPFVVNLIANDLILNKFLPDKLENTVVSLYLDAKGNGFSLNSLQTDFSTEIYNSVIESIDIQKLNINGNYDKGNIKLDALQLINNSANIEVSGAYSENGLIDAHLDGNIYNLHSFNHFFEIPAEWERIYFQGDASGLIDSLALNIFSDIHSLKKDTTLSVNQIKLKGKGVIIEKKIFAEAETFFSQIETEFVKIETATLISSMNDSLFEVNLKTKLINDLNFNLLASGNLGKNIEIFLHQLDFESPRANLTLANQPALITYCDSTAILKNFNIINRNEEQFSLNIDAYYSFLDSLGVELSLNALDLKLLSDFELFDFPLVGNCKTKLKFDANKQGTSLFGNSYISGLELDNINIQNIILDYNYNGDMMLINTALYNNMGDSLSLKIKTPLIAKLQDSLLISWSEEVFANILAENLRIKNFIPTDTDFQFDGFVNIDLDVNGTIYDPHFKGDILLSQGTFPMPKYGIDYRDILLKLSVIDKNIEIDKLFIRHAKGTMSAQGHFELDSITTTPHIKNANLDIKADRFYVSNHKDHQVEINADIFLKSDKDILFGGKINVLRAWINVPAVLGIATAETHRSDPLLIQALSIQKEHPEDFEFIIANISDSTSYQNNISSLLKKVSGSIKIEMPRNIWLKSDEMQMELQGNLEAVKSDKDFELFGTLGVRRGFYILYGKKLNIKKGEITFSGGTDINPDLNITTIYNFRSNKQERHELTLAISGKINDPVFNFLLDSKPIPEADAMSYLVFGQSFDELSHGTQETMSGALPSKILTNMFATQISKKLENKLHLDMVEIESEDNWQDATFMVGKYITKDLFVSYKNSFGQSQSDNIAHEIITMEYEFTRRLSLRLMKGNAKETGIDFIVKFEK